MNYIVISMHCLMLWTYGIHIIGMHDLNSNVKSILIGWGKNLEHAIIFKHFSNTLSIDFQTNCSIF